MGLKHVFHEWNCWVVVIADTCADNQVSAAWMGLKHVFHEWNCWVVVIAEPTRLAPGYRTHSTRLVPPPGAGDEAVVGPGHTRIQKVPRGLVPPRFTLRTQQRLWTQKLIDPTV